MAGKSEAEAVGSSDEEEREPRKERKRDRVRRVFSRIGSSSNVSSEEGEEGTKKTLTRPANHPKRRRPLVTAETGEDTTDTEGSDVAGKKPGRLRRFFRRGKSGKSKAKDTSSSKAKDTSSDGDGTSEESTTTPVSTDDEGSERISETQSEGEAGSGPEKKTEREDPGDMAVGKPLHDVEDPGEELVDADKKREYQIRVRVIEAKELEGTNLNPICRVHIGSKTRSTRVRRSTENPKWDQTLFCTLKMSLTELSEKKLEFKIYNARRLFRGDNLIGAFSCNMALIHRQKRHAMINRWLALTREVEERSDTGVSGYVKVCTSVLGPGQIGPSLNVRSSPKDDVESNVLFGGAAQFRTVTLQVRVMEVMDLPILQERQSFFTKKHAQMEAYNFFVRVSVGGQTASTKLSSSVSPHIFQEIRLPIKWPSVASFISLQLIGSRKPREEIPLGTVSLRFRDICFPGLDGFLPCFGPSYLTFYGSDSPDTRERRGTNLGRSDTLGNEYHGRILLHVATLSEQTDSEIKGNFPITRPPRNSLSHLTLLVISLFDPKNMVDEGCDAFPTPTCNELNPKVVDLGASDILRIAPQIRTTAKHTLLSSLFAANMIAPDFKSDNVCLEISVGPYGNEKYPGTPPCASRTTACMPMYDKKTYYCMPWGSMKPCCLIPGAWEDYSYRIGVSNSLEEASNGLQEASDAILRTMGSREDENLEMASKILDLLETSLKKLRNIHLDMPSDFFPTELDIKLIEVRRKQLDILTREMIELKDKRMTVETALEIIAGFAKRVGSLAKDPQIGIPDIIVWMVVNGERKAYARLPAKDCFYCGSESGVSGRMCGNLTGIYLKWPSRKEQKSREHEVPALLHLRVFFTFDKYRSLWENVLDGAKVKYFAETFQNETKLLGIWKHTSKRPPKFSDERGKQFLPPDIFKPPPGWKFKNDKFKVSNTHDVWVDPEGGFEKVVEEVYEVQELNFEDCEWEFLEWTDYEGNVWDPEKESSCPPGWRWTEEWKVDLNCPGDDEGFTYQTDKIFSLGFEYAERVYHRFRRRRWTRKRIKTESAGEKDKSEDGGWEYGVRFGKPTHHRMHPEDGFRRRRWHNEILSATQHNKGDITLLANMAMRLRQIKEAESGQSSGAESEMEAGVLFADVPPRVFVVYETVQRWELRAYILQGRDIFPARRSGSSSTFIRAVFMNGCMETQVVPDVVNPIWNQTLIFGKVMIPGTGNLIKKQPPSVEVEVFHDEEGRLPVFLGRFLAQPSVCLGSDISDRTFGRDEVKWFPCQFSDGKRRGDILAAFELFEADNEAFLPSYPFKKNKEEFDGAVEQGGDVQIPRPLYIVPKDIRPEYVSTCVDLLCWGVRNLRRYHLFSVRRPFVEMAISNKVGCTESLKDAKKNPNFDSPILRLENVLLPKQIGLAAPITLSLVDTRLFGRKPVVGVCLIKDFRKYLREKPSPEAGKEDKTEESSLYQELMLRSSLLGNTGNMERKPVVEAGEGDGGLELDWWSKYYASIGERNKAVGYLEAGYEPMEVLDASLEDVPHYGGFNDFCDTFKLHKVKKGKKTRPADAEFAGEIKGRLFIYRNKTETDGDTEEPPDSLPPLTALIPGIEYFGPTICTVRVYVIRGEDLASRRRSGKADPYLEARIGKGKKQKTRKRARWDTLNPVFGEVFEFPQVSLPQDKTLKVTVKDRRRITADGEIGSTVIDLENRLMTKWRATVGLPSQFNVGGPYVWRDQQTPMQILRAYCKIHKFPPPRLIPKTKKEPMEIRLGSDTRYKFSLDTLEIAGGGDIVPPNPDMGEPHQRLALHVLRRLALVPEHVETRSLYNSGSPDTEQGKLQMWVDILPLDRGPLSPALQVSPRQPTPFQLRVVVWNVRDALLERESFGEKSGDFYVKCFMNGYGKGMKTDVHYRSLDGVAMFNWRMMFNFDFDPWERSVVLRTRRFFWERKREERVEPELLVQLWDNHKFGRDKYLGQLRMNLLRCEEGQLDEDRMANVKKRIRRVFGRRNPEEDGAEVNQSAKRVYEPSRQRVSLFDQVQSRGWWPVMRGSGNKGREVTGKVELEMNLLRGSQARKNPVGKGRKEPNMDPFLPKPKRPVMDRHWLTSRVKAFYRRVWKTGKWWILLFILLAVVVLAIVAIMWNLPTIISDHERDNENNPGNKTFSDILLVLCSSLFLFIEMFL